MNNYFNDTKTKEERSTPRLHRTAVSSQFSATHQQCFPQTDLLGCQRNKIQSKHEWFRISKFKNVLVKSSRVNCHELKTYMINTSNQKTNIEKRRTVRKITKVLPNKLVNISHRPTARIFHNCMTSNWESIKILSVVETNKKWKAKNGTEFSLQKYIVCCSCTNSTMK